ncbi:TetR/AcrR family transcriptional regulator [Kutzneria sp. CA-103260]|uniref:TetR/AcrR family transcriptional regulator n=1 Tax=Kutzneria sp. CA-103260 TaxID=2802641 RepID=UPI001BA79ED0|nr:TetR/AcrR family transcriptional regulator [Kutzneria sp. CA-103260]QUQ68210.1 DNA-binding transcriptional repressor TetR [Kutzneria sp. CA-103260]
MDQSDRARGRPRDRAIDDAALQAARDLLVEVGWDKLSMVAIADRAAVGRPALYRRWPSKTHLVFEAVFSWQDAPTPVLDATTSSDWVRGSFAYTQTLFHRPEVRAALPGLMASLRDHPDLQSALWKEFGLPGLSSLESLLRAEGASDPAKDAQATMVLVIGACMVTSLLGGSPAITDRLPDLLRTNPI